MIDKFTFDGEREDFNAHPADIGGGHFSHQRGELVTVAVHLQTTTATTKSWEQHFFLFNFFFTAFPMNGQENAPDIEREKKSRAEKRVSGTLPFPAKSRTTLINCGKHIVSDIFSFFPVFFFGATRWQASNSSNQSAPVSAALTVQNHSEPAVFIINKKNMKLFKIWKFF